MAHHPPARNRTRPDRVGSTDLDGGYLFRPRQPAGRPRRARRAARGRRRRDARAARRDEPPLRRARRRRGGVARGRWRRRPAGPGPRA
nr:hypothetical protein [Angustibacter aerolatus]